MNDLSFLKYQFTGKTSDMHLQHSPNHIKEMIGKLHLQDKEL